MLDNLLKLEKFRSALTSTTSGAFTFILLTIFEYFKVLEIKNNDRIEYFIFMLFCFLIGYSLDILFAKKIFGTIEIPYGKMNERIKILINKYYLSPKLIKYLMVVVIDNIFNIIVVRYLINKLNHNKILTNFKYRDIFLVFLVFGFSFIVYSHNLRFLWAYQEKTTLFMNILVTFIFILSIIIYFYLINRIDTKNINKSNKLNTNKIKTI